MLVIIICVFFLVLVYIYIQGNIEHKWPHLPWSHVLLNYCQGIRFHYFCLINAGNERMNFTNSRKLIDLSRFDLKIFSPVTKPCSYCQTEYPHTFLGSHCTSCKAMSWKYERTFVPLAALVGLGVMVSAVIFVFNKFWAINKPEVIAPCVFWDIEGHQYIWHHLCLFLRNTFLPELSWNKRVSE